MRHAALYNEFQYLELTMKRVKNTTNIKYASGQNKTQQSYNAKVFYCCVVLPICDVVGIYS
ncbi:hypothetical protein FMO003_24470 [Moritella sp. F3]|nr:hypothetical protein FMO001_17740 [Moritella sp. F1]GIC82166.1 hypothetical protein FMO003_24470 [Moritella sp. F3]